ncbi:MAG: hypothetical protein M3Y62_04710 [Candidatus Dormibacteraeota bacterium]|nr:hypothetical protein [Candidatus Dormibacteraeota bacterium]
MTEQTMPLQKQRQPGRQHAMDLLASDDSSYMADKILHPNGGQVVNG